MTSEVRMFSIEAAVRAQKTKVPENAVETSVPVVLNILAGKDARAEHPRQAPFKSVAALKLIPGNEVRLVQSLQVSKKAVPAPVLINGNEVKPEH